MAGRRPHVMRPVLRYLAQPYWRLTRGQTLGVRAIVRDADGQILLVRHTYAPGWSFPGGGVEHGETLEETVIRELSEEVGVSVEGRPQLFGVYANFEHFPGDHVALFVIDQWTRSSVRTLEIAEDGFFPPANLPDSVTDATRRRLSEFLENVDRATMW